MNRTILLISISTTLLLACSEAHDSKKENLACTCEKLMITEFSCNQSTKNEFGILSDWIEIYNPNSHSINFSQNCYTLSDNPKKTEKFKIPDLVIPPNDFIIIWCDKSKKKGKQIHANFKLSTEGELISLYCNGQIIDFVKYSKVEKSFESYVRPNKKDEIWIGCLKATPGLKNQ